MTNNSHNLILTKLNMRVNDKEDKYNILFKYTYIYNLYKIWCTSKRSESEISRKDLTKVHLWGAM